MNEKLHELADKLGIAFSFSDAGLKKQNYTVDEKVVRFFAKAMGYAADTDKQSGASLDKLEKRRWQSALQPVYVCRRDNIIIDVVASDLSGIVLTAETSGGETLSLDYEYRRNAINRGNLYKEDLKITTPLDIGYYDLKAVIGGREYKSCLAVAPDKCYDVLPGDRRLWGFSLQLYALKSRRNWGVGDFTDLKNFVCFCRDAGADIIGLNPLNVLSHDYPEEASPYSSISRLYLNPIYIDIEAVPEFMPADRKPFEKLLDELRATELIRYTDVYTLKVRMLEKCFTRFRENKNTVRQREYAEFCEKHGESLQRLAVFQAIYEQQTKTVWGGWQAWPKEYHSPSAAGVRKFAADNQERVEFFKFMQFEADRQLSTVKAEIDACGLRIGLYRDLAVGVGRDSAENWSNPGLFMKDAGTGAPPDAFFPGGQKWGLGTFLPQELKEQKYQPFIRILRANMQNAGALRIDHVMSLMRLFVIPDTYDAGTYIYYNFEDMLNIVALESCLNKCMIVGESIGNVPPGFIEAINERGIRSLSVLWAERWNDGWGDFKAPEQYPANAFASVGTHDIAPLRMWWFGYDIELNFSLGIIENTADRDAAYHKRENDRGRLLAALDKAEVWPEDKPRSGDYLFGEKYPEGIEEAVMRFMAKSAAPVFLAQLEDILHVEKMQNVPGTDRDKHPNWRRRLPVRLEDLTEDIAWVRCIAAIHKER